jgi:hypothetical protein
MLLAFEHSLLSKGLNNSCTSNTFIADSGANCLMQGSLEGIFNLKPSVTDIIVGNNEVMLIVSMGHYKGLFLNLMVPQWINLLKMYFSFQNSWSTCFP